MGFVNVLKHWCDDNGLLKSIACFVKETDCGMNEGYVADTWFLPKLLVVGDRIVIKRIFVMSALLTL